MTVPDRTDVRLESLRSWLTGDLGMALLGIAPASADASFRRYFRVTEASRSLIAMDAPPEHEDLEPFLRVARLLADVGVNVPRVLAQDLERGFLLLTDLGSQPYLDRLRTGDDADRLYADALESLARIQTDGRAAGRGLPPYDEALLRREMQLMPDWFLARHLRLAPGDEEARLLERVFARLVDNAREQPASLVHRDYHSRNLMIVDEANPGILDFQDAVFGPVTYDLVSLLKDCYVRWPLERAHSWALDHRERLRRRGLDLGVGDAQFLRWFDLMGMQRHVKVLGIFCRLWYRDGKRGYLGDLPLVLRYVRECAERYAEFRDFSAWIAERIAPAFEQAQARESAPANDRPMGRDTP